MIKDDIQKAIFSSLKQNKQTELKVLRFIMSVIKYAEIDKKENLTDEETVSVLQKEVKKRKEAIEMFRKGKRDDLVADEEKQLKVIGDYLPKELNDDELEEIIKDILKNTDHSNVGRVIGEVMKKVKGRADGNKVAVIIKQSLSSK